METLQNACTQNLRKFQSATVLLVHCKAVFYFSSDGAEVDDDLMEVMGPVQIQGCEHLVIRQPQRLDLLEVYIDQLHLFGRHGGWNGVHPFRDGAWLQSVY